MSKAISFVMHTLCVVTVLTGTVVAAPIGEQELEDITASYKRWWDTDLEMNFEKLPKNGMVEKSRMPWSGHIYPDRAGGCVNVLRKYDQAFHGGYGKTSGYERHDIAIHRTQVSTSRRGFLGRSYSSNSYGTPHWAGHCNGWTAAAIRHAEPEHNVTRNGVVFRPSDIKGLMAELYVYGDIEMIGGSYEYAVNAATLHLALTNWVAKGHTIGMDNSLGKEIWNYPIYSFKSSSAKRGDRQVEVRTNLGFVNSTDREYDQAPKRYKFMFFHYWLDLDEAGKIVGGGYYNDSNRIDLLWVPLQPAKGGSEGNKEGNPHLDPKEVLALWRDSVSEEARENWYNINPWPEDAIVDDEETPETGEEVAEVESELQPPPEDGETRGDSPSNATETSAEDSASSGISSAEERSIVVND
jgi:hypothetical protein